VCDTVSGDVKFGRAAAPEPYDRNLRARGLQWMEVPLEDGLKWLVEHQAPDGHWDADGFRSHCPDAGPEACDGTGVATEGVGVTGLALLALLRDGHTTKSGRHRDAVKRAAKWLRREQDPDNGRLGSAESPRHFHNHAIATLALCELYGVTRSPLFKRCCQKAIQYIGRVRNADGGWSDSSPSGDVMSAAATGWAVRALLGA
jgi:hypothetical protein